MGVEPLSSPPNNIFASVTFDLTSTKYSPSGSWERVTLAGAGVEFPPALIDVPPLTLLR